jgi:putative FmdB family regulatory protein
MPNYLYECGKCGRFEVMQGMSEAKLEKCPTCDGSVERLVIPVNISPNPGVLSDKNDRLIRRATKASATGKVPRIFPYACEKCGDMELQHLPGHAPRACPVCGFSLRRIYTPQIGVQKGHRPIQSCPNVTKYKNVKNEQEPERPVNPTSDGGHGVSRIW